MRKSIHALIRYMQMVTGVEPKLTPAPDAIQRLPVYFGGIYEAWEGELLDRRYLLLLFNGKQRPSPSEVAGHYNVAMRELGKSVAFVFDEVESFGRRRLVQYRVPFVVPGRQMYLPMFLIDFREKGGGRVRSAVERTKPLSGAAQALLLYYLQKPTAPELCSLGEWASLLGYSAMTTTRIASELAETQLCKVEQRGRKFILDFDHDRRVLWERALPFLRSPVRGHAFVRFTNRGHPKWLQAGLPAVSIYTMLASDGDNVLAVGRSEYARAIAEEEIQELHFSEDDSFAVERWRYRPEVLSDGSTVDRLSLFLSLREDPDERVQVALRELLEGVRW